MIKKIFIILLAIIALFLVSKLLFFLFYRVLFLYRNRKKAQSLSLEEFLYSKNFPTDLVADIVEKNNQVPRHRENLTQLIYAYAQNILQSVPSFDLSSFDQGTSIILVMGVNGVGKTTTIAKMANLLKNRGKRIIMAAGDTFRAAAQEQIAQWATTLQIPLVTEGKTTNAVVNVAIEQLHKLNRDILIVDSAGRMHNKGDLMDELSKVKRTILYQIKDRDIRLSTLLVIDAITGNNALQQALQFHERIGLDGIIITKYDASKKGGMLLSIIKQLQLPIYFIGDGEGVNDLYPFDRERYLHNLID